MFKGMGVQIYLQIDMQMHSTHGSCVSACMHMCQRMYAYLPCRNCRWHAKTCRRHVSLKEGEREGESKARDARMAHHVPFVSLQNH